jgi:preprotein translocase subunit SecB
MAENETNGAQGTPAEGSKNPVFHVAAQYIKDLSFENPGAPRTLTEAIPGGGIKIEINVNGRPLNDSNFEVELSIEARAGSDSSVVFNLELLYAGVFRLENVPREQVHPLVMIEGPRLLFPFARQILADATRNGGFPPLLIDPVDFAALYRQRVAQMQAKTVRQA